LGLVERRGGGAAGVGGRDKVGGARTGDDRDGVLLAAGAVEWANAGLWSVAPAGPEEHPEVLTVVFAADVETFAGVSTGGAGGSLTGP
jgi:hypothetical protein